MNLNQACAYDGATELAGSGLGMLSDASPLQQQLTGSNNIGTPNNGSQFFSEQSNNSTLTANTMTSLQQSYAQGPVFVDSQQLRHSMPDSRQFAMQLTSATASGANLSNGDASFIF